MKIFAFEYVTGGGMAGEPLPPALTGEADMMVRALITDLLEITGVRVLCSRDPRLPAIPGTEPIVPGDGESVASLFARGVSQADAVWPTAPETGGVLADLAETVLGHAKILLGCSPAAVRVAASKRATAAVLAGSGIPVVPTFGPGDALPPLSGRWVIKPDDGAGSDGVRRVQDWREAAEALNHGEPGTVAQPWVAGAAGSLSLLCSKEDALLLAANRQIVRMEDERPRLQGLDVNAIPDTDGALAALGRRVARAIPGLWGYVGVDVVLADTGVTVLEVNPRLTTSYCGLRPVMGINVARMELDLLAAAAPGGPSDRRTATHHLALGAMAHD